MVDPLDIRVESEIEREIEAEMAIEEGQGQASSASLGLPLFKVRREQSAFFRVRSQVSKARIRGLIGCGFVTGAGRVSFFGGERRRQG